MKGRKLLILAIVMIVIVMTPLQSFANEEVDKHIPKIKQIFSIGDEYSDFNMFTNEYDGKSRYDLSWGNGSESLNVEIDTDGNIISYNKHSMTGQNEHSKFPKITKEEGLKKAKEIIGKIDSSLLGNIEYEETQVYGSLNSYYFRYIRTENDVPFSHNSIRVEVDTSTGEISHLYINWDKDLKLPNKNNIINEAEASKIYKENQGVELTYRLNNKLEGKLLYSVENRNLAIDAKTGKSVEKLDDGYSYLYYDFFMDDMKRVSSEEQKRLIDSKEVINKSEAEKVLRNLADLDKKYSILGSNLNKSEKSGRYLWELNVHRQEGNSGYGTNAIVDAKTKEVLSFNKFDFKEYEEPKYSEDEALKKAQNFLKSNMSEKYKDVEYIEHKYHRYEEDIRNHSFMFSRVIDGVKVPQNGFSIGISAVTGDVTSYNYIWNEIEIPSKEEIIDKEKAEEILLGDTKLELSYTLDKESMKNDKKEAKLVYGLNEKSDVFIDVKTGKKISMEELFEIYDRNEGDKEYKDIDKSFAKEEINKLKEHGIFLTGEEFKPKEHISQKEFLYLLMSTDGYRPPYEEEYIYSDSSYRGIIKKGEKNPDKSITRVEAVKYIIRSLGQEKAASLGDVYRSNYSDIDTISKELKGYVAVAEGLGIVSGKGNFRPNDNLTREEAAILIYNILNRD